MEPIRIDNNGGWFQALRLGTSKAWMKEMSEATGINLTTLYRIQNGETSPRLDTVLDILQAATGGSCELVAVSTWDLRRLEHGL